MPMVHALRCALSLLCWHDANRDWHRENGRLDARRSGHWPQHVGFTRMAYRHLQLTAIVKYIGSPVLLLAQLSCSYFTNKGWTYAHYPLRRFFAEAGSSCSEGQTLHSSQCLSLPRCCIYSYSSATLLPLDWQLPLPCP